MIAKRQALTRDKEEYIKPIMAGLPVAFYTSVFTAETYNFVNWHWHEAFQYALVTEGNVTFQTPNNSVTLKQGEGIFLNYKQPHLIKMADNEKSSYICLDVPASIIDNDPNGRMYKKYISPLLEHDSVQLFVFRQDTEYNKNIIESMSRINTIVNESEVNPELKILTEIFKIWDNTISQLKIADESAQGMDYNVNHRLRKIFRYVSRNYQQKISLDDIAAHVNLSRSECSRFFHKSTEQSLFDFITDYRISQSIVLLEENKLSIADIASEVGFSNQSYYTKIFKQRKGMTPKEYRKLCIKITDIYTQTAEN